MTRSQIKREYDAAGAGAGPAARIIFPLDATQQSTTSTGPFIPEGGYNDYSTAPMVFVGMFTPAECARIVAMGEHMAFENGGLLHPREGYRSTLVGWLQVDDATRWIYTRIAELFVQVNRWYRFELSGIDVLQFARYREGDGFDWHLDTGPGTTSTRKLSLSVQLSAPDDYDGGGLEFCPLGELAMARPQGTVIVFPSFAAHRVTPVTRGCRHSLVAWANGPVFR